MKKTKLEKGITLIALIITIVVLLILAAVTIGAIQESKIIAHAKNASSGYKDEKSKEESEIAGYESLIDSKLPGGSSKSNVTYKDGVPVPSGFYYVTGTKDTGFVISDNPADENNASGKSGNQFVWVPVTEDISTIEYILEANYREPEVITREYNSDRGYYITGADCDLKNLQRAECIENSEDNDEGLTEDDFKVQLTKEYKAMAESVNKYDGFYVGRYETSMNGTNPQSKYGATSATATTDSANTWYGLYALNKKYTTSSVQSSMIWGIQYDKMIDWMGSDVTNFNISNRNTDEQRRTGYVSTDVIKNIYDLYGNSFEWTIEAHIFEDINYTRRVYRGGSFGYNCSSSDRNSAEPTFNGSHFGSRLTLYIV